MAITDAFSAQIVKLVRQMPDEAILALVKNQLGALGVTPPTASSTPTSSARGRRGAGRGAALPRASTKGKRGTTGERGRRGREGGSRSEERQELLNKVEQIVKASDGVSASDVSKSASIPQTRAAAALKELKLAKRIFQGGDRRFARYAGDQKTAEQASTLARKTATGPTPANGKKMVRGKRQRAAAAR